MCKGGKGFDFASARRIGYDWVNEYLAGMVNNDKSYKSWSGNSSLPEMDVLKSLFPKIEKHLTNYERKGEYVERILMMPFGDCLEVKNYSKILYIGTNSSLKIYMTDPYRQSYYRIEKVQKVQTKLTTSMSSEALKYIHI